MINQVAMNTIQKTGKLASLGAFFSGVIYAIVLTVGLSRLASPEETIQGPIFSILEVLIIVITILMILLTGITTSVHFVILTLSHQNEFAGLSWFPLFFSYRWPSVDYVLDILSWDLFFGLSMLFAAPIFTGDKLNLAIAF